MMSLTPAPLFQSHMVFQRDKPLVIWGEAPAFSMVCVTLNNLHKGAFENRGSVNADAEGHFLCRLAPVEAGRDYTLSITCDAAGTTPVFLTDVSVGEVWLACGQSNMEFFLRYDRDWEKIKEYETNPDIRMYNVPQKAFEGHKRVTHGSKVWFREQEPGWEVFSACGYSFARHIQPVLKVPVGIIGCNWGGTTACAWLDEACLSREPLSVYLKEYEDSVHSLSPKELERQSMEGWDYEDSPAHQKEFESVLYGIGEEEQLRYIKAHKNDPVIPMGPFHINRPGGLYRQMLSSLIPFSIRGVLWYQGESDAGHAAVYDRLFTALIECWREKWEDAFPFLFVQLAPFEKWLECDAAGYPELRRRQELVSQTVPNTFMTSIMDIGMYHDIHPKKKLEVGRRLALLARGKVYGEALLCEPPELSRCVRKDHLLILTFSNCEKGLFTANLEADCSERLSAKKAETGCNSAAIHGFILTQDHKEVPIDQIRIDGSHVILKAFALKKGSCTLNFAWSNYVEVNLWNEAGLPAKPFRRTLPENDCF